MRNSGRWKSAFGKCLRTNKKLIKRPAPKSHGHATFRHIFNHRKDRIFTEEVMGLLTENKNEKGMNKRI